MLDHDSTLSGKPGKPYPEFRLYVHACGQWTKKIKGKTHFFGPWRNQHKALQKYLDEKDDLETGRPVRVSVTPDSLSVEQLVCRFRVAAA